MRYSSAILALASILGSAQAIVTVATPTGVTTCQPTLLTWTVTAPSTGPYIVQVIPGGDVSAAPLATLTTTSETSFTWNVSEIPAGTQINIAVKEASGAIYYSAPITILQGSTTSCTASGGAGGASPASGSGAQVAPTTTVSPSSVVPVAVSGVSVTSTASVPVVASGSTTSVASTLVVPSVTTSARPTSASASTTAQPGAANAIKVPVGLGMIAAAVALF